MFICVKTIATGLKMDEKQKINVALVVNYMPHYRDGFYKELFRDNNYRFDVFCHVPDGRSRLKTVETAYANTHVFPLHSIGNKAWFSFLPFRSLLSRDYQALVIEGNPRFLSHFFLASIGKIMGKPVLIWAMAKSPNASLGEGLRLRWMRGFNDILVYTKQEIRFLEGRGYFGKSLTSIDNGLNQRAIDAAKTGWPDSKLQQWRKDRDIETGGLFLSCARLEPKNQFDIGIRAFAQYIETNPMARYAIVGDGPETERLAALSRALRVERNVMFLGAIHRESELAPWFLSATALLHPGSIGLSIFHALGYGLPVITNSTTSVHAPEFSALLPGVNGLIFDEGDIQSLLSVLNEARKRRMDGAFDDDTVSYLPRTVHNTDRMAANFLRALDQLLAKRGD